MGSRKGKRITPIKNFASIMTNNRNKLKSPEKRVESHHIKLEELDKKRFSFWEDYWLFLAQEREKKIDDIKSALLSSKSEAFFANNLSRIVSGKYSMNPLCTKGSVIKPPGGRFNFGNISSSLKDFHCLYVASDYDTAFAERYHYNQGESIGEGDLLPEEMSFEKPGSFLNCQLEIDLEIVLDLRNGESLNEFVEVISKIKPSQELKNRASELKLGKLTTVNNVEALKLSLFADNYKQWGTWISQPANSQCLGHYAYMSGIQGIIYPSVRSCQGYNLAVFPDNFLDTDCYVKVKDEIAHLPMECVKMDSTNYTFF